MTVPLQPKIYHIVHVDRLSSIIDDGYLWCDSEIAKRDTSGSIIGMDVIKSRRLNTLFLTNYPDLSVGACVPFYFCPRSIMLYMIDKANHPDLSYRGGQGAIIHLEFDLYAAVEWAIQNKRRWAFTLSNAGANYFEDRISLDQLNEINWEAVNAIKWSGAGIPGAFKEGKQAEFLMEQSFPWHLIERVGVHSQTTRQKVMSILPDVGCRPRVEIAPTWYY